MSQWSIPRELRQPVPRLTGMSRKFRLESLYRSFFFLGMTIFSTGIFCVLSDGEGFVGFLIYSGSIWATLLILIHVLHLIKYFKDKKLVAWGCPAEATFISIKEVSVKYPSWYLLLLGVDNYILPKKATEIIYEFTDNNGQTIHAVILINRPLPEEEINGSLPEEELKIYKKAKTVLYDPCDSSKNRLYPRRYVDCYLS